MIHSRIPARRTALAGTAAALLATAALTLPSAHAAPASAPGTLSATRAAELGQRLTADLGAAHTAGSYYDAAARKLVVGVVDGPTAARVRAAGAEARTVAHSAAELASARGTLKVKASIPGTTWSVDPRTNKVVVTADSTVEGAGLARLEKTVAGLGDKAALRRTPGTLRPLIAGGDAIWGSGVRCSLGFNVTKGGKPYFLTAGHCGNASASWSASQGGARIGTTESSTFPGHDYAIVRYTSNTAHPSAVDLYGGTQRIARAAAATVGEQVRRSGSTTQVHDGEVTALDVTVNYEEGAVEGMIGTSVCAEPGDSGGALFDGDAALGLTSGGSGDCSSGGETFFQPVPDALTALGAQLP
ncbi:S1 family peptidase [Streptomyces sp. ISL-11]|uniref:S1 family peptidase n=1 Tax=Streptomyces sp. ISL-11 TaxID=2819174 RepID=UPI0027E44301|nr:S1 family peptidase [Streptomyces sp. ISL-11]